MEIMKLKNALVLIFLVLAALVISALISRFTADISWLEWLTWGDSIGFEGVTVDLIIFEFSFSFLMQVNVLQILLLFGALLLYRKVK